MAAFGKLKASLTDLIKSSGSAIEKKTELKGQVAVKIVEGKNLISTTEKQMGDDAVRSSLLWAALESSSDSSYSSEELKKRFSRMIVDCMPV